jgi:oligopeptide transport system substrate-binding protein
VKPLILLIIALSAGGAWADKAVTPSAKVFTFRLSGEPETLDWNLAHTMIETYVLMNLMEGLVSFDSSNQIVPALAESWTISKDGKTYTFKLRKDAKWSDGVPLKAQDFVYGWKRLLSPSTAASYAYLLFDIEGAEDFNKGKVLDFSKVGIKALDERTFQAVLARPVAHWIDIPTFWVTFPMREDVVQQHGSAWARPGRMVTAGPFMLTSYDANSRIVMKANPYYSRERGNVDEVVGLIISDDSTAMKLYEAGRLDFLTDISTLDLSRLAGRPDLKTFPYLKIGYMGFALSKYPASNVHLRRALSMAIDKSKVGALLHGGQQPATSFVPPPLMAYSKSIGLPYDPVRAKREFKASGLDPAAPLSLDLLIPNWDKQLILAGDEGRLPRFPDG